MQIIRGKVRHGDKRGTALGVPTANMYIHQKTHQRLRDGIYIACATVKDKQYPSIAFIGPAPTFNRSQRWLEVHLLNTRKQLYDQWITVQFINRIRPNKKFASTTALKRAMKKDITAAQRYFTHHPCSQA